MKRIQLFEFEDFHWLPSVVRTGITHLIVVFHRLMGTAEVVAHLVHTVKAKKNFQRIVDLGAGSGGAMFEVIKKVNAKQEERPVSLLLTDLHPNPQLVKAINDQQIDRVSYHPESINATHLDRTPNGLKTMIASFHHLPPETARQVLQSAQAHREPILIYEVAKNNIPLLAWVLFLPLSLLILILMSMVMTLFVRPLSLSQILLTYLLPIIPLVYAWDGQASLVRTYTFEDVEQLIGTDRPEDYHWEIGDALKANGKKAGYYIMGYPMENEAS